MAAQMLTPFVLLALACWMVWHRGIRQFLIVWPLAGPIAEKVIAVALRVMEREIGRITG